MSIVRVLPATVIREINKQNSAEAYLVFVTIMHPKLNEVIRVVTDTENFILDTSKPTEIWQGFTFEIKILSDSDEMPQAQIKMQNVDRRVGTSVLNSGEVVRLNIEVIALSQFDVAVFPRVPFAMPVERIYSAKGLFLTMVKGDSFYLSGTIKSYDYTQETWPGIRATEDRCPALYW